MEFAVGLIIGIGIGFTSGAVAVFIIFDRLMNRLIEKLTEMEKRFD